jgi:hypothetical protein
MKTDRLLRLERETRERVIDLSDEQIRLLERFDPEYRERHIETRHTGDPAGGPAERPSIRSSWARSRASGGSTCRA